MKKFLSFLALAALALCCKVYGIAIVSGPVAIAGGGIHTNLQLEMSLGGRAVAIWVENFPPKIEANIFNGTNWQQPVVISLGAFPQVGIDNVGNAIAIWVNTSNNQIFTSRYSVASNTWSAPLLLSIAGGVNAAPQIGVDPAGNALAVWVLTSTQQIVGSSFNITTLSWSSPVVLANTGSFPLVAVDNLNHAIVMWNNPQFGIVAEKVRIID